MKILTAKFYLDDPSAGGKVSVKLYVFSKQFSGKRLVMGMGQSIPHPDLWDPIRQRPTSDKEIISRFNKSIYQGVPGVLARELSKLDAELAAISKDVLEYGQKVDTVSKEGLTAYLYSKVKLRLPEGEKGRRRKGTEELTEATTLSAYMEKFITDISTGARRIRSGKRSGQLFTRGTTATYRNFFTVFSEYQTDLGLNVDFEDVGIGFYDRFLDYCQETRLNYKDGDGRPRTLLGINTTGKHVKILKSVMRAALEEKIHSNRDFEHRSFSTLREDVVNVYLTAEELDALYNLDLSGNPSLEISRDVFLIGCHTAQRFSDYSRFRSEHIKDNKTGKKLCFKQKKENVDVVIPVSGRLDDLLSKYGYNVPFVYEQKLNRHIKQIAEMAGIDEEVVFERKNRHTGKMEIVTVPKYKLIRSHTARRTGATLLFLEGAPLLSICRITGHVNPKHLLKYICVSNEDVADDLSKLKFFSPLKIAR